MERCHWCTQDPLYIQYHDTEWGVPSFHAPHLFEKLILEGFQAGLSWFTILRKREHFRSVLHRFNPERLAALTDADLQALMQDPGIVRNRLKLQATRRNAQAWLQLNDPVDLIWSVVNHTPIIHHYDHHNQIPATSVQGDALCKHLRKAGFTFVGPTICHAYLQGIGAFMDHTTRCHRHAVLSGRAHTPE